MNLRALTYAEHEAARKASVAARKPKGYRLRAAERRSAQLHEQLRRELRDTRRW